MPTWLDGLIATVTATVDVTYGGEDLATIITTLGSTRSVLFPFLEQEGSNLESYDETSENLTAKEILGVGFSPIKYERGIHSYFFQRSAEAHLAGNDAAVYSGGSGSTDAAWSVGAWIFPTLLGTQQTILSKYNEAGTLREYQFLLNSSNKAVFEWFDESLADGVTITADVASAANTWESIIITSDGAGGTGAAGFAQLLYKNGAVDSSAAIADTGGNIYEDMEDSATPLLIGATGTTAAPLFLWEGRIALPFMCGKTLTATEVLTIHNSGQRLLGLA